MKAASIRAAGVAAFALLLAGPAPASKSAQAQESELSSLINMEMRSDGPWFTAEERAVIERKCGYAPGEWDGFEANLSDGALRCTNGRVVDDEETRALFKAAEPRIRARVARVMESAAVQAAIARTAAMAAAKALRELDLRARR